MNIWIINEYAGSPYHGMVYRHYYLAKEWVKKEHNVNIITASYSHLLFNRPNVTSKYKLEKIDGINYLWVKVPKYKNSFDIRRIIKWIVFTLKLFFLPVEILKKPDIIILSSTEHFPIIPAYLYSKKLNAKLIVEVRDIWPLTLIDIGGYSNINPLILILKILERFSYKRSDIIVSVIPKFKDYINSLGIKNKVVHYIPNGITELDVDKEDDNRNFIAEEVKKLKENSFIVGYVGKIGESNALEFLVRSAVLLKDYEDIKIVIIGDGMEKQRLIEIVRGNRLKNVFFFDHVKRKEVVNIIKLFDIGYIGLYHRVIYKYGVSLNKLFDYMYSAKPILFSYSGGMNVVDIAHCGITVEAENPEKIAEGIINFYKMDENLRIKLGLNGRRYVLKNNLYNKLAEKYLEII